MATEFNEANFETEVLQSSDPVMVDFWAPWCGPCRQLTPLIEELSKENDGSAKVGKVNIDDNQQIAEKYGIMGIPTIIVFKNGEEVQRFSGVKPKSQLQEALDAAKA